MTVNDDPEMQISLKDGKVTYKRRRDHQGYAYALFALVASALVAISIGRPWLSIETETEQPTFAQIRWPTWDERGDGILLQTRPKKSVVFKEHE
jgi:hypothetical protein